MSLSFVSKTVQTSTEDGGFEEKPIEGAATEETAGGDRGSGRSLFEQLRANQEQEDAEREEYKREMMRGTLALDEEDCAHLNALAKQRREQETARQRQTQDELDAFRAAQAERLEANSSTAIRHEPLDGGGGDGPLDEPSSASLGPAMAATTSQKQQTAPSASIKAPSIVIKKKRRRQAEPVGETDDAELDTKKLARVGETTTATGSNSKKRPESTAKEDAAPASLGGLLTGYGSSSHEDD